MSKKPYCLVLAYTISRHATERGARLALKRLTGDPDDLAFVVELPEGENGPPSYVEKKR